MRRLLLLLMCLVLTSMSQAEILKYEAEGPAFITVEGNNWSTVVDDDDTPASGGAYITATQDIADVPQAEETIRYYQLDIPAGTYDLYIRLNMSSEGGSYVNDSFWCSDSSFAIDAGMSFQNGLATTGIDDVSTQDSYGWLQIDTGYVSTGGVSYFKLQPREDGLRIDAFAFATGDETITDELLNSTPAIIDPTLPYDPIPGDGADSIGTVNIPDLSVTDVDLAFKAGRDPNYLDNGILVNSDISSFNIWFSTNAPSDPNLFLIGTVEAGSLSDPNRDFPLSTKAAGELSDGTTYQWQVEQIMINPDTDLPFAEGDPNNILSPVWSFTTSNAIPEITPNTPYHTLTDFTGAGSLTVVASETANSYQWFKVVGEQDTEGLVDDIELSDSTIEGLTYAGTDTATLTVSGMANDGSTDAVYYAIAYNGTPGTSASVASEPSDTAWVWYPREVNHYTFDAVVPVDSNSFVVDDISGFNAQLKSADTGLDIPTLDPNSFFATGNSLLFDNPKSGGEPNDVDGQYAQMPGTWPGYKDVTISAWIYWKGGAQWQRILELGNNQQNRMTFLVNPNVGERGNALQFEIVVDGSGQAAYSTENSIPQNEWVYVTATLTGDTAKTYVNGEFEDVNTGLSNDPIAFAPTTANYISYSTYGADTFNGYIDDLRVWNYAFSNEDVAKRYMIESGDPYVCDSQNYDLAYDWNDNCIVDLGDFAIFAAEWLDTYRIYPTP